jgi:hypothetical protein
VYVYGEVPPKRLMSILPSELLQFELVTLIVITDNAFGVNNVANAEL